MADGLLLIKQSVPLQRSHRRPSESSPQSKLVQESKPPGCRSRSRQCSCRGFNSFKSTRSLARPNSSSPFKTSPTSRSARQTCLRSSCAKKETSWLERKRIRKGWLGFIISIRMDTKKVGCGTMGAMRRKNRRMQHHHNRVHCHSRRRIRRNSLARICSPTGPVMVMYHSHYYRQQSARNWDQVVRNRSTMIEMHAF